MSVDYIVSPVTDELLEWGRQCGVPVPAEIPRGCFPKMIDISDVLESLAGYTYSLHGTNEDFHGNIESVETTEFVGGHPDPDLDAIFGGPRIAPQEFASFSMLATKSGHRFLAFHGNDTLVVRIAQELTTSCGPFVVYVTENPDPIFLLSRTKQPIWKEPWF